MERWHAFFTGISAELIWIWHTLKSYFLHFKDERIPHQAKLQDQIYPLVWNNQNIGLGAGRNIWSEGMQDTGNQATEDCGPYHTKNKGNTANYPSWLPWENFQDLVQREQPSKDWHSLWETELTVHRDVPKVLRKVYQRRQSYTERQLHRTSKDLLKNSTERRKRYGYVNVQ